MQAGKRNIRIQECVVVFDGDIATTKPLVFQELKVCRSGVSRLVFAVFGGHT